MQHVTVIGPMTATRYPAIDTGAAWNGNPVVAFRGHVLARLIENGDVLAFRLAEADQKPGRSRMARKAKAASSVRPTKPTIQPESVVTQVSAEQAATEIAPER